jgi:hypothetical protein
MPAPDPESFGLLEKVLGAAAAIGVPIWGARTWLESRFAKKADKEAVTKENANCLRHIEKLYENAEEDRKLTRDLHDKAMERIQVNQTQLIDILGRSK